MCKDKRMSVMQKIQNSIDQDRIMHYLSANDVGIKVKEGEEIEIIKSGNFDALDPNTSFYYYTGPDDEKTRDFCRYLLRQDKLYSQDELRYLSEKLGYDVFLYMGAYNCRHDWVRARIKGKIQQGVNIDIASDRDARRAASRQDIIIP